MCSVLVRKISAIGAGIRSVSPGHVDSGTSAQISLSGHVSAGDILPVVEVYLILR